MRKQFLQIRFLTTAKAICKSLLIYSIFWGIFRLHVIPCIKFSSSFEMDLNLSLLTHFIPHTLRDVLGLISPQGVSGKISTSISKGFSHLFLPKGINRRKNEQILKLCSLGLTCQLDIMNDLTVVTCTPYPCIDLSSCKTCPVNE